MTSNEAGKPEDAGSARNGGFGTPDVNYAEELADEIVEIQSHVTRETKAEAVHSLRDERNELEYERLKVEVEMLQAKLASRDAKNKDRLATTRLRGEYAEKAYKLAMGSISFWIVIIGFEATVKLVVPERERILSDPVLIAITTGCTVNVLAAFLGVIRGLFPIHSSGKASAAKKKKKDKKAQP